MHDHDPLPHQQSYLQWYLAALGTPTLLLIVGVTLITAALMVLLFVRGRGPAVPAAMLFLMPLPLILGVACFLGGTITYLNQLAVAGNDPVSPNAFSYALVAATQASSCFCPVLMLGVVLLMVLGFRANKVKH